jgi:hypothetical protein
MSLATPTAIRTLQRKLYRKAKRPCGSPFFDVERGTTGLLVDVDDDGSGFLGW